MVPPIDGAGGSGGAFLLCPCHPWLDAVQKWVCLVSHLGESSHLAPWASEGLQGGTWHTISKRLFNVFIRDLSISHRFLQFKGGDLIVLGSSTAFYQCSFPPSFPFSKQTFSHEQQHIHQQLAIATSHLETDHTLLLPITWVIFTIIWVFTS